MNSPVLRLIGWLIWHGLIRWFSEYSDGIYSHYLGWVEITWGGWEKQMDIDLILVTSLRLVDSMLHNKLQKWEFFSFCLSFVPKSLCNLSFAVCYQKSLQVGCCSLHFSTSNHISDWWWEWFWAFIAVEWYPSCQFLCCYKHMSELITLIFLRVFLLLIWG